MSDAPGRHNVQRVLIVRPSALGDVARSVPALVSLRRAYPAARIDWLVADAYADMVRHHPALHAVVPFPRRRFGAAWRNPAAAGDALRWAAELRRAGYDVVFDLQGLLRSGLFTWLTRAPRRVGFANAREAAAFAYHRRHPIDAELHTVDRMLALLEAEGVAPVRDMRLHLGSADEQWLEAFQRQSLGGEPYATLAPTARWRCKCWPLERYVELGRRLLAAGWVRRLVILAGPGEAAGVQPMLNALGERAVLPATSVGQLMALVSAAALHVGNDSAPLHVAVGFDRPLVGVFGPTNPRQVGPYQHLDAVVQPPGVEPSMLNHYRRRRDDQSLIARVSVDAVWAKVEPLTRPPPPPQLQSSPPPRQPGGPPPGGGPASPRGACPT